MFNRESLFGGRGQQGSPQPPPSRQAQPSPRRELPPAQRHSDGRFSDPYSQQEKSMPPSGRAMQLRPAKSPDNSFTFGNICAVSDQDIAKSRDGDTHLLVNGQYVSISPALRRPYAAICSIESVSLTYMTRRTGPDRATTVVVSSRPYQLK